VWLLFYPLGARVLLDGVGKEMTSGPHESMGDGTAQGVFFTWDAGPAGQ
jgi:hypothetical protein